MAKNIVLDHNLQINHDTSKEEKYSNLLIQIKGLIEGENDLIANLSNILGTIKFATDYFWVGCYRVIDEELILGPFQGPVACSRISKGKGVCGQAWIRKESLIVADVDAFPDHISCSSQTRSEIVVPVFNKAGEVVLIIDIDSDRLNDFSAIDKQFLEGVASLLKEKV